MALRSTIVPLIVACPLFLQNVGLSAITVALPVMAQSLHVPALHLSVVVASYAIALAAFLPLSAWVADRFGAKRTFCVAIGIFSIACALCGFSNSALVLVLCRIAQGLGAAMMVPVSRLILIRSVPSSELVMAMVWFTIPPAVGRLMGPLIGGLLVTYANWRWIFFICLPLGLLTMILSLIFIKSPEQEDARKPRFDAPGFLLLAFGLGGTLGGLEILGQDLAKPWVPYVLTYGGAALLVFYGFYSWRRTDPAIDLRTLKYPTFRTNIVGALPFRLANTGVPFLVPLMLQLGFGMSALASGLVSAASALGSISTRVVMRKALRMMSFKKLLMGTTLLSALSFGSYGLLSAGDGPWLIFSLIFFGGLVSSLCLVSLNMLGFLDMPSELTSHGTAMLAMAQQVTSALGVVIAAALLRLFSTLRGGEGTHLLQIDFTASFIAMGVCVAISLPFFARLNADEGKNLK